MKRYRWLVAGLVLGLGVSVVAPGAFAMQNVAAVIPGVPPAVNILPSVATGAAPAATAPEALALMMLQWSKQPAFWNAAAAVQAGSASSAQTAMVAAEATTFAVPATKAATLIKAAGPVGAVITSGTVGLMMGDGVSRLFGFKDEMVCSADNAVLTAISAVTNGVDCGIEAINPNLTANGDVVAGTHWPAQCVAGGKCYQYLGSTVVGSVRHHCWAITGAGATATGVSFKQTGGGTNPTTWYTSGAGGTHSSCNTAFPSSGGARLTQTVVDGTVTAFYITWSGGSNATSPSTPTTLPSDPSRLWRCKLLQTIGPAISADSTLWREGDADSAPIVCPDAPPGSTTTGWQIEQIGGGADQTVLTQPTTPEYQEWQTTHPTCNTGTCMLDLKKDGTSCFSAPTACVDWFTDPNKTSKYSCEYGSVAVDLAECNLYAPTFDPAQTGIGNLYGNPLNGSTTGVQTGQRSDTSAYAQPTQNPVTDRKCFPEGWAALNPVEWVMRPVQCALEWAFVPRPQVVTQVGTQLQTAMANTSVVQTQQLVAGFAFTPAVSSNCMGPPVVFDAPQYGLDGTFYPLNACSEPMKTFATVAFWAIPLLLGIGAALAVVRYFASSIGFTGLGSKGETA